MNTLLFKRIKSNKIILVKNSIIIHEITPTNETPVKMYVNCTDISEPTIIDWGDGTTTEITNIDKAVATEKIYTDTTKKTITVTGKTKSFLIETRFPLEFISGDLSSITDLTDAWHSCSGLTSFDSKKMYNINNVTNLAGTWNDCSGLISFDTTGLSGLTNVTDLSSAWFGCSSLTSFDTTPLSGMTQVTNLDITWSYCSKLTSFDFENIITDKLTTINGIFKNCYGLTSSTTTFRNRIPLNCITTEAFRNCVKLIDYAEIPTEWK